MDTGYLSYSGPVLAVKAIDLAWYVIFDDKASDCVELSSYEVDVRWTWGGVNKCQNFVDVFIDGPQTTVN